VVFVPRNRDLFRERARVRASWGLSGWRGNERIGNCNFLPGSARRLELGTVSAEPPVARVLVAKLRPLGESFEAGQAMSHSDANCAKPRTGFRSRPADPWKLGARSLPEQQPPPARAPGGPFLIESAILSFPLQPLRPHNARTRARGNLRGAQSGEEMKGLVDCNFLPGRLELEFQPSPRLARTGRKTPAARRNGWLVARAYFWRPIALKRAVGLSGPSTGSAPPPTTR
jgi:hypothetical protein